MGETFASLGIQEIAQANVEEYISAESRVAMVIIKPLITRLVLEIDSQGQVLILRRGLAIQML